MFSTTIERIDGDLGIRLPDPIVRAFKLADGDEFIVHFEADRIYLELERENTARAREAFERCKEQYGETLRRLAEE